MAQQCSVPAPHNQDNKELDTSSPPPAPPLPEGPVVHLPLKAPTCLEELEGEWYEVDLKNAIPADVNNLDWSKAVGFSSSDKGSEGVFFVQFQDQSVVSLKGSSTIAADMYALALAHSVGVCVPDFRSLRIIDDEFQVLSKKMEKLDEKNNPLKRGKHVKLFSHPVILVMEFISGKSLVDMMHPSYVFGKKGEVSLQGTYTLQEFAKITVYDAVINNWDRIPLIWDNEGNPENILFTKQKNITQQEGDNLIAMQPVAIDNSVTSIDPTVFRENYEEYLDKVRYVINEVCMYMKVPKIFNKVREEFSITCYEKQPSVRNVTEFIKKVTSFVVKNRDCMDWFMIGFIQAIDLFSHVTYDQLEKMMRNVAEHVNEALPPEMTADCLAMYKVNTQFLDGVIQVFREAAPILLPLADKLLASKSRNAEQ